MSITIGVIFSADSVKMFEEFGLKCVYVLNDVKTFSFETNAEVSAFLNGVDDSVGYDACKIKKAKPGSKISQVAFCEDDGEGFEYLKIQQGSEAERIAYEAGVEACEGWFGYQQLGDQDLNNYLQAKAAAKTSLGNHVIRFIQSAPLAAVA
jgi:hypothetical protein